MFKASPLIVGFEREGLMNVIEERVRYIDRLDSSLICIVGPCYEGFIHGQRNSWRWFFEVGIPQYQGHEAKQPHVVPQHQKNSRTQVTRPHRGRIKAMT